MIKILASSDWHGDHSTHGVSRFAEIRDAVHHTVDRAIEEDVTAYAFLGDLCDPDSGSCVFRVVELAIEAAVRLAERAIDSIWLAGNHDVVEDQTGNTTISPLRALAGMGKIKRVHVLEQPDVVRLRPRLGGSAYADVLGLPFTASSHSYDPRKAIQKASEVTTPSRLVILSHLSVPGVVPGEETHEMPRGRDVVLPAELAVEKAKLVLQGHYHRQQRTKEGIWIAGSLARLTFNEERHEPGYLLASV